MTQLQTRKHFLAKALGLVTAAVAVPGTLGKGLRRASTPSAPKATRPSLTLQSDHRVVARRNDTL